MPILFPWSAYIFMSSFHTLGSALASTPKCSRCCCRHSRPRQNWATFVRSKQSMQLVRMIPSWRTAARVPVDGPWDGGRVRKKPVVE